MQAGFFQKIFLYWKCDWKSWFANFFTSEKTTANQLCSSKFPHLKRYRYYFYRQGAGHRIVFEYGGNKQRIVLENENLLQILFQFYFKFVHKSLWCITNIFNLFSPGFDEQIQKLSLADEDGFVPVKTKGRGSGGRGRKNWFLKTLLCWTFFKCPELIFETITVLDVFWNMSRIISNTYSHYSPNYWQWHIF